MNFVSEFVLSNFDFPNSDSFLFRINWTLFLNLSKGFFQFILSKVPLPKKNPKILCLSFVQLILHNLSLLFFHLLNQTPQDLDLFNLAPEACS